MEEVERGNLITEIWLTMRDPKITRARANEEQVVALEGAGERLQQAQHAKKLVTAAYVKDGVYYPAVYEPDHATAISAIKTVAEMHEKFQEKKGTEVNVGVQTNIGGNQSGHSFEERVRMFREKRGLTNAEVGEEQPADEEEVLEGEFTEDDDEEEDDE